MNRWRLMHRQDKGLFRGTAVLLGALAFSLGLGVLLLALQGKSPVNGMQVIFSGAFGSSYAFEDALVKAIPLYLCSLGVAMAFRLQIWNIGAEGQFALGAIGATWAALSFPALPWFVLLPFMALAAAVFGSVWGIIPAVLKVRMGVNEIIVTLMMNYIGVLILEYLVFGPWKDSASFGFPMTPMFSDAAIVGSIPGTAISWGLVLCVVVGLIMGIFFRFTRLGFELKIAGSNPRAAAYGRISYGTLVLLVMGISGAFAGWAGFLETSSNLNRLQASVMSGYGYTAIVVAWLARLSPLRIAVASYLLAALMVGVENLQLEMRVPAAFGDIMEGLILLSVLAGGFFLNYRFKRIDK
ncbi:MAG: ABC transporter permease [Thermodesulfobacteriota bacterium]